MAPHTPSHFAVSEGGMREAAGGAVAACGVSVLPHSGHDDGWLQASQFKVKGLLANSESLSPRVSFAAEIMSEPVGMMVGWQSWLDHGSSPGLVTTTPADACKASNPAHMPVKSASHAGWRLARGRFRIPVWYAEEWRKPPGSVS